MTRKHILYAVIIAAAFAGAVLLGRLFRIRMEARIRAEILAGMVATRDTTFVRETTFVRVPVPDPVYIEEPVTVFVEVPGDTVRVPVPASLVQRHYSGAQYEAWVSGLQIGGRGPALDSIRVETLTQTVTQTVAAPLPKARPLRIGAEGFVTVTPRAESPGMAYGPAGYVKYRGEFFELKGWGGYDFAGRSAVFGATASIDIIRY